MRFPLLGAALAALLFAVGASGADSPLVKTGETPTTISFKYAAAPDAGGYRYYADGVAVARTFDPTRLEVKFAKGAGSYRVVPMDVSERSDGYVYPAPVEPPPSEFPNASNTGVPAGTILTAYTGPSNITTPNTVIDGKTISQCLQISAPGVVIRNSRIAVGNCTYVVFVDDRSLDTSDTPLLIEDSEISCLDRQSGAAVGEADFVVRRVEITHCENGFDINQNVLVEDSFIHDLYTDSINHMDGAQFGCGHWDPSYSGSSCATGYAPGVLNVTFRHNTIYAISASGEFGTSAIISNRTPNVDHNVLIENNLMAGGAYTLYCDQDGATGVNYRVINNRFSTRFSPKVGFYGVSTDCGDEQQSGNVIHETGAPLRLG